MLFHGKKLFNCRQLGASYRCEKLLLSSNDFDTGITRLCFQPYTHIEIKKILEQRLAGSTLISSDALQLVSRKVASVSGDLRRGLEICRLAVDIAKEQAADQSTNGQRSNAPQQFPKLGIAHVNAALKHMAGNLVIPSCHFLRQAIKEVQQKHIYNFSSHPL
ncbi:hypothetical protein M514_16259 [Trichuris suis]|uniref:Origin recognition complex subunit 1 n=1 Tax=Trichuris suis TaxID=68888 RepID=A0A085NQJ3_9BILA|nr:hypothetical protein M514_16259 [Trichuris suis]